MVYELSTEELDEKIANKDLVIGVVGLGYVGLPLAAVFADKGFNVVGYDIDEKRILDLKDGKIIIKETGLDELLAKDEVKSKLMYADTPGNLEDADYVFMTVGTPWDEENRISDISQIKNAAKILGQNLKESSVIALKSTVAPGTTRNIFGRILNEESRYFAGKDFGLVFSPERSIEGQAIKDYLERPKVVGGYTSKDGFMLATLYDKVFDCGVVSLESCEAAEMFKLADNWYRDMNLAFANNLAQICAVANVDVLKLREALLIADARNASMLYPGCGVGGSCLNKDPYALADFGERFGVDSSFIYAARNVNNKMPAYMVSKFLDYYINFRGHSGVEPRKVGILGLAFKDKTDDLRKAPSLKIIRDLVTLGVKNITAHDKYVKKCPIDDIDLSDDLGYVVKDRDTLFVCNETYGNLKPEDYEILNVSIGGSEDSDPVIFDGKNVLDRSKIGPHIKYFGLGRK
jgi:nucleotide sugar dehydrogenase